jgi:hypothetical protein
VQVNFLFLLRLQYGYLKNKDMIVAALHGSISASFTVEQVGVPQLHATHEEWNKGPPPTDRLLQLQKRIANIMPISEHDWSATLEK